MFKQFTYSAEPSIIGVDNGFSQLEFKECWLKKHEAYKEIERMVIVNHVDDFLKNQHDIKLSDIDPLKGVLYKDAKTTDFMVFSPFFFGCKYVVSQKVVDCFRSVGVSKIEYNLIPVDIKNTSKKYYLLFVPVIANKEIIFSKSYIYHKDDTLLDQKNYLPIKSYGDYQEVMKKDPFHSFARICLPNRYESRDIISVQGAVDLFFSERLIECLQGIGATNFEIPERQVELVFSELAEV